MESSGYSIIAGKYARPLLLLIALLAQILFSSRGYAQSSTVTGTVKDSKGVPQQGVSVNVKGSSVNTATDAAGKFTIPVADPQATLVFSYVGFLSLEEKLAGRKTLDITLNEKPADLNEVVVVGYGTQKKADLTGAIATVSGVDLNKRVATDPTQLLQGKLPGLSLTQASGEAGNENSVLRVRGLGTYSSAGSSPLVIVDGIPGSLTALDPQNIASVTLLKDAASASIYGTRAANGVILVTTKQGVNGKFQLSYDYNIGITRPTSLPDLVYNSVQYMQLYNQAAANSGVAASLRFSQAQIDAYANATDKKLYPDVNWLDLVMRTVNTQTHHLGLTGGRNGTTYNLGLGYVDQPDIMIGFSYKKYNLQFNLSSKVNDNVTFGTSLTFNYGKRVYPRQGSQDQFLSTLSQSPLYGPRLPDGSGRYTFAAYPFQTPNKNPVAIAENALASNNDFYMQGNIFVNVKLLKDLEWRTSGGFNFDFQKIYDYKPVINQYYWLAAPADPFARTLDVGGQGLTVTDNNYIYPVVYSQLTWGHAVKAHHFKVLGGTQAEYNKAQSLSASRTTYPSNNVQEINAGGAGSQSNTGTASEWSLLSFYGRLNYDYDEKYLLEANARYDASSRFPPNNRWGLFPSVSVGWVASKEHFLEKLSWLGNLKFRASLGTLGNQNIGNYPYQSVYNTGYAYPYTDAGLNSGAIQTSLVDAHIKWEATRVFDLGADIGLFNNRLNLTVDWYNKLTYDILSSQVLPSYIGLVPPTVNNGRMKNTGIELSAQYSGNIGKVHYSVGGNIQANKNTLVRFGTTSIGTTTIIKEGQPYGSFYLYEFAGIFQSAAEVTASPAQPYTPVAGTFKFKDEDNSKVIDAGDRVIVPGIFPKFDYSFNAGASYKAFDLSFFLYGSQGQKQYVNGWGMQPFNQGSVPTKDWFNAWTPQNQSTTLPLIYITGTGNVSSNLSTASTYYLRDASFLRLKNLQLGYTVPAQMAKHIAMSSLRVYFAGDNLLTFSKFPGLDPERIATNTRYVTHPQNRVFSFGVKAVF